MYRYIRNDEQKNCSTKSIICNSILAAISLFINGFGVYLTIQANIGVSPWDVLNLGISNSFGILYGTASIIVSYSILGIDILMKAPIGIAMFIDAFVVGKSVDLFNYLHIVEKCDSTLTGIFFMIIGLIIIAYTQFTYMIAALGCGPRDTLLVALSKRVVKFPIGIVSIVLLSSVTFIGWLLGGPVGIGTIICAFGAGPIMQLAFNSVHFDAERVNHQQITESIKTITRASS